MFLFKPSKARLSALEKENLHYNMFLFKPKKDKSWFNAKTFTLQYVSI